MLLSKRGIAIPTSLVVLCAVIVVSTNLAAAASSADEKKQANVPVNINTAAAEQLTAIPGIGEAMARRIVEWREEHGPFGRIEDLMKVKGIGEKSLEKMRPHITVGGTD